MNSINRDSILCNLRKRNKHLNVFVDLVVSQNKFFEISEEHKTKSVQLTLDYERLKQDNADLLVKAAKGDSSGNETSNEAIQILEKQNFQFKDELIEIQRTKGEISEQLINCKNDLQEKEKELMIKNSKITELESRISILYKEGSEAQQNTQDLINTNQHLNDELQASQLAYASLEEKNRLLREENNELVKRMIQYKARDADLMNAENDNFMKQRQSSMQVELAEAANEQVDLHVDHYDSRPPICFDCVIPKTALCKFDGHEGEVNAIKWSPSGRQFASGGTDRKLKLWEVNNGKCESKAILSGSNQAIMSVEFDSEENVILAASNDYACRVWALSSNRLSHTLTGHNGKVLAAKFLGNQHKVVTGSHDRTVRIWDLRSIACIKTMFAGSSCNDLITSDAVGCNVISGHFDKKIRFWDTRSDSSKKEISLSGRITSLDLSPDKYVLMACTRDDTIKLVDLRMNSVSCTLSAAGFHVAVDWTRASFSPDGKYVMAGSGDGSLIVWDIAKKKVDTILKEHTHGIVACSWHPSGHSILTCDRQRKIILWSEF